MTLLLFGAQGYALGVYKALTSLYPKRTIPCFMVSAIGNNAAMLGGIPVKDIDEVSGSMTVTEKMNSSVFIATPENVQPEIEKTLENYGFRNHTRLTSERWNELMKLYHAKLGQFLPLSALPVGCNEPFLRMYMAKSHVDKPLRQPPVLPDYVYPLQVGAESATARIADIMDNTGDNISERNGNYSELTGLYWLWKNRIDKGLVRSEDVPGDDDAGRSGSKRDQAECERQYYGFGQYRRMLEFNRDDLLRLIDNDVDVVLPYPLPYEPNIHAHHERYIKPADWDALLQALEELEPEYRSRFDDVLKQQYLYNYNVILAKRPVLCDYCSWLFPILMKAEELTGGAKRSERYIGYMAETLETLYFIKNSEKNGGKLNVVHTFCRLYS